MNGTPSRVPPPQSWFLLVNVLLVLLVPVVARAETSITVAGTRYGLYKANLHIHTIYSQQKLSLNPKVDLYDRSDHSACVWPGPTCRAARMHGMDVVGFSDHAEQLDLKEWQRLSDVCGSSHDDYTIIGLRGCEWTPENSYDHVNIFRTQNPIFARTDSESSSFAHYCVDLQSLYGYIRSLGSSSICQFNHPAIAENGFQGFKPPDGGVVDAFALLEVWSPWVPLHLADTSSTRWSKGEECYRTALSNGWHVAPTAGLDNQEGTLQGVNYHYTGVWAKDSTSEAVLQALRSRRVFATGCNGLSLIFRAFQGSGEYFMGDTVTSQAGGQLTLTTSVQSPEPIDYVRLVEVRANQNYSPEGRGLNPNAREPYGVNTVAHGTTVSPVPATLCYYIRVRLTNGEMAISAPIWVGQNANKEDLSAPIFVLDRSGSMDAAQAELNRQAETCVDYLMEHVSAMAVVNFNGAGTATVDAPLTKDRDLIVHAIRYPSQTSGSTAIYDAVVKAVDEAVAARQNAMIILLTDGANNSGRANLRDAIAAAQRRDVPCMTVGFCRPGSQEEADMLELAHKTTGIYYHTSNFDVQRFVQDHITFSRARRDTNPVDVAPPVF